MCTGSLRVSALLKALLFSFLAIPCTGQAKADTNCKTYFSVVWKDHLNNIKQGLSKDDAKWMQEKMQKKYPGVCYAQPDPSVHLVFWIAMTKDTHHGYRTSQETHSEPIKGEVRDDAGNTATIKGNQEVTTTTAVPESFDYPIFTLSVTTKIADTKWSVLHNFQRKGLCHTLYGIPIKCHTSRYIIEDAMKWIHEGGLTDPLQTVLGQEKGADAKPEKK